MKIKISWVNILRTLRNQHGLTQAELASVLHISRAEYANIERGYIQPTAEMIAILTDIYDTDIYRYALNSLPEELVAEQNTFKASMDPIPKSAASDLLSGGSDTYYGKENEDILKHLK